MRLCLDDDLVFCIDGGNAGVALNHTLGGRHLGGFVVSAVAFANGTFAAFAIFGMGSQPVPELCGIGLQAFDAQ